MLIHTKRDIFKLNAHSIVNPVNCVGVMGKGLALEIKERYPWCVANYLQACAHKELLPGMCKSVINPASIMDAVEYPLEIIHLATKDHWRDPSKLEWIEKGLNSLVNYIQEYNILSIHPRSQIYAVPLLGVGNGKLDKDDVIKLIDDILGNAKTNCVIYAVHR